MPGILISSILLGLASYLLGAIPFSFLTAKFLAGTDIRQHGSGNPGASNVARVCGKGYGLLSLLLDVGKGVVAVYLVSTFEVPLAIGTLAILGHITSPFLNFSGGKGVATTLGCVFMISWSTGLVFTIVWATSLLIWNYAGLSSILAIVFVPAGFYFFGVNLPLVWISVGLVGLIYFTHRSNIQRIVKGEENDL